MNHMVATQQVQGLCLLNFLVTVYEHPNTNTP